MSRYNAEWRRDESRRRESPTEICLIIEKIIERRARTSLRGAPRESRTALTSDAVSDAVAKATVAADYKQHSGQPSTTKYREVRRSVPSLRFSRSVPRSVPASSASRPRRAFPG